MQPKTTIELERMREQTEETMGSLCLIGTRSEAVGGDPGNVSYTFSNTPVICGIKRSSSREVMDGSQVTIADVEIRVPLSVEIPATSRIRLIQCNGLEIEPEDYAVLGAPMSGLSCKRMYGRRIVGGSSL